MEWITSITKEGACNIIAHVRDSTKGLPKRIMSTTMIQSWKEQAAARSVSCGDPRQPSHNGFFFISAQCSSTVSVTVVESRRILFACHGALDWTSFSTLSCDTFCVVGTSPWHEGVINRKAHDHGCRSWNMMCSCR